MRSERETIARMTPGQLLRRERLGELMSVQQLAELGGVSKATVRAIEDGEVQDRDLAVRLLACVGASWPVLARAHLGPVTRRPGQPQRRR